MNILSSVSAVVTEQSEHGVTTDNSHITFICKITCKEERNTEPPSSDVSVTQLFPNMTQISAQKPHCVCYCQHVCTRHRRRQCAEKCLSGKSGDRIFCSVAPEAANPPDKAPLPHLPHLPIQFNLIQFKFFIVQQGEISLAARATIRINKTIIKSSCSSKSCYQTKQ